MDRQTPQPESSTIRQTPQPECSTIGRTPQPECSTIRQTPQPSSSIGKVNNNYTCNSAWCVFSSDISHVIVLISIENL